MKKLEALDETTKMWIWLYRHPAQDKKYYVTHVARLDKPWKNNCPLCEVAENDCSNCLMEWEDQKGTFCSDPESPYRKWQATSLDNPDYRTLYAGEVIAIAQKVANTLKATA